MKTRRRPIRFEVGGRYELRNGDVITLRETRRHAPGLTGPPEIIMQGQFPDGELIAFRPDGGFRAADPQIQDRYDIVRRVD